MITEDYSQPKNRKENEHEQVSCSRSLHPDKKICDDLTISQIEELRHIAILSFGKEDEAVFQMRPQQVLNLFSGVEINVVCSSFNPYNGLPWTDIFQMGENKKKVGPYSWQ